jgi:hypothetical protein
MVSKLFQSCFKVVFGTIWNNLEQFGAIWNNLERHETI